MAQDSFGHLAATGIAGAEKEHAGGSGTFAAFFSGSFPGRFFSGSILGGLFSSGFFSGPWVSEFRYPLVFASDLVLQV